MELVVSIISILIMVTVTVVVLYQNAQLKDKLNSSLQSVVDQVNDSTLYAYRFDKNQDTNIKHIDNNMKIVQDNLVNVSNNVKALKDQVLANTHNSDVVMTKTVKTNKINLGDKNSLQGTSSGWVQINNSTGTELHGGLAAANLYVTKKTTLDGTTDVAALNVTGSITTKGGRSEHNPNSWSTHFPYSDGNNYIRGNTEIRGNTVNIGDFTVQRKLCIGNTCINEAQLARIKQVTGS